MEEPRDLRSVIESAEQAAAAGDYASAEQLLREVALLQETHLGRLHPDLANTLNNLGVVYELTGRPSEAEDCYRRAFAIAKAVLEPSHPFVATSGQNLRDLCEARGTPVEPPAALTSPAAEPRAADPPAAERRAAEPPAAKQPAPAPPAHDSPAPERPAPAPRAVKPEPHAAVQPRPLAEGLVDVPHEPTWHEESRTSNRSVRPLVIGALLAGALGVATIMAARAWFGSQAGAGFSPADAARPVEPNPAPTPAPAPVPAAPSATPNEPATRTPSTAPVRETPRPAASAFAIPSVVDARVCAKLSTQASDWQCDPASAEAQPGTFFFYTRLKSPTDTIVEHRWYQGQRLHQAVELKVLANPGSGYRTYSRNTVIAPNAGEWRVELRAADGSVLDEQRFTVR